MRSYGVFNPEVRVTDVGRLVVARVEGCGAAEEDGEDGIPC